MHDLLLSTILKVALPALAIGLLLLACKRRQFSLVEDIGIRPPRLFAAATFLILWVCLIAVEEYASSNIPGSQAKPWPEYPGYIVALRILAIGLLGPIAEELGFRGLLMAWIRRTRLGIVGAIVITAALWSAMHLQYSPALLTLIFLDGIVLGLARYYSRSLLLPIVMHIGGNLFSISQSLAACRT